VKFVAKLTALMPAKKPRPSSPLSSGSPVHHQPWRTVLLGSLLLLAVTAVYWNSTTVPFLFDDGASIGANPTIRQLWPIGPALHPPSAHGETVGGRPLVNLTLAFNYAISGSAVWSYHVFNILVHALATLTLFGVIRRTLLSARLQGQFAQAAPPIAFFVALLWGLHPLQTECVTYIIQRAESLVSLFLLLTLYSFIRSKEPRRAGAWSAATVVFCLLGMATKEVMVVAPLLVLLHDRAFVSGCFDAAWRAHRRLYIALASTWLLLGLLVASTHNRGGSAGLGATGATSWSYALTQLQAIARYLRLTFWPKPLIFDYGNDVVHGLSAVVPEALLVAGLLCAVGFALRRRPALGFSGAWFFVLLAPSSSVIPVTTQTLAEHRVYLALAAPLTLAVLALRQLGRGRRAWMAAAALVSGTFGLLTIQRNRDYATPVSLWRDTAEKQPTNPRAHGNLGIALFDTGHFSDAVSSFERALYLRPDYGEVHYNFAKALTQVGRIAEAIDHYETAIRLQPDSVQAHNNLGRLLFRAGRIDEAIQHYRASIRTAPEYAPTYNHLALALIAQQHPQEAQSLLQTAVSLDPEFADAHLNLGHLFFDQQDWPAAAEHYAAAVRLKPRDPAAHQALADAWMRLGRATEAEIEYATSARLDAAARRETTPPR
jgi:tetratricopeptide (TPR) repeat protein